MQQNFAKKITQLRKEKGLTQKSVAARLNVSQALLSHYENGIRECSLDFLCRVSEFYGVSTDYLLGFEDSKKESENVPWEKNSIDNSIDIIYKMAEECQNKNAGEEAKNFLMLAVYRTFRQLCVTDESEAQKIFSIPPHTARAMADASMQIAEVNIANAVADSADCKTTKSRLSELYKEQFESLEKLINATEKLMNHR